MSANGTYPSYDALRNGKEEEKKKKDVYRFRKYITHSTRGHCVSRHVMRTEKSRTSADVAKKEKKETKESRHQRPQVGFLAYNTVRDSSRFQVPPPPRVRRGASVSPPFRNSWANNSTENTHRDV